MTSTGERTQATVERQARPITIDPRLPRAAVRTAPAPDHLAEPLVEHELRRFPLGVVGKWAVTLGMTTAVAWWAAIAVMWLAGATLGLTSDVESLAREVGFEGFRLASGPVFVALALIGAAWILAVSLIVMFAAAVYNLYASFLGGIRVESIDRSVPQPVADAPVPDRALVD